MKESDKQIGIWGSCVSRDMFSFCEVEEILVDYRARSSLTGYGQIGLTVPLEFLNELSGFRKSTVIKDLTKVPLPFPEMNFLLIDLIDERFGIFKKNETFFSRSTYLEEVSGISELKAQMAFERGSEEHMEAFELGVRHLLNDCRTHGVTPILHQSRWATKKQMEGIIIPYSVDEATIQRTEKENQILGVMESYFVKMQPMIKTVCAAEFCIADSKHKWGLQPFHYAETYYHQIYSQLSQIMST